jgi:bacillithiol system protein YtxJ
MTQKLKELRTIEELDQALSASTDHPVLLFKHSIACAISSRAFSEFETYLERADPRISYKLITVQTARSVSNEAASRLQIEHESPQAILVRDGRGIWSASHNSITASSIDKAIRETQDQVA